MTRTPDPHVWTVPEAAQVLHVSKGNLHARIREQRSHGVEGFKIGDRVVPVIRIGTRLLVPRQPLLDALNRPTTT